MQGQWSPIDGVTVLGIVGHARHGKDELAKAFIQTVDGAERWALSDAVAAVARACHGMRDRDPRVLQEVGTDYRRRDPTVWLRCLYGAIADKRPAMAIITGVRYPNEAELVEHMGGALIGVVRPACPPLTDRDPDHEVESHIDALLGRCLLTVRMDEYPDAKARAWAMGNVARNVRDAVRQ